MPIVYKIHYVFPVPLNHPIISPLYSIIIIHKSPVWLQVNQQHLYLQFPSISLNFPKVKSQKSPNFPTSRGFPSCFPFFCMDFTMENPTITVDKSLGRVRGQGMRQGMRASVALRQLDIPSLHLVGGIRGSGGIVMAQSSSPKKHAETMTW